MTALVHVLERLASAVVAVWCLVLLTAAVIVGGLALQSLAMRVRSSRVAPQDDDAEAQQLDAEIANTMYAMERGRMPVDLDLAIAQRLSATEPTAPMIAYAPVIPTNHPFVLGNPITGLALTPGLPE